MPSPIRDGMSPEAGKMRDSNDAVFDFTEWIKAMKVGITTVTATLTGFLNTLPWGIFHTTPTTRTDGQGGPLETDALGNLRTTPQSFDSGTGADKTTLIRDISDQFLSETPINATNLGIATYYYPSSSGFSMDGYKDLSLELDQTGVGITTTVEGSENSAFTVPKDITKRFAQPDGTVAASYAGAQALSLESQNLNRTYVRIKVVVTDAVNTLKISSRRKAL